MPGVWSSLTKTIADALILKKVKAAIGLDQAHMLATGAAPISAEMLKFFTGLDLPRTLSLAPDLPTPCLYFLFRAVQFL